MQHATPDAYRAEARRLREVADQREKDGKLRLARQFREMADDCDQRADQLDADS